MDSLHERLHRYCRSVWGRYLHAAATATCVAKALAPSRMPSRQSSDCGNVLNGIRRQPTLLQLRIPPGGASCNGDKMSRVRWRHFGIHDILSLAIALGECSGWWGGCNVDFSWNRSTRAYPAVVCSLGNGGIFILDMRDRVLSTSSNDRDPPKSDHAIVEGKTEPICCLCRALSCWASHGNDARAILKTADGYEDLLLQPGAGGPTECRGVCFQAWAGGPTECRAI